MEEISAWFSRIDRPELSLNQVETFDAPVREDGARKAMKLSKSGKAPGLDVFFC